ncbi:DUF2141 domain-containing protein [Ekhidna sp.]|uniref:DUF2141 domain-containing protein n=1 Tax=Ekhidna sp. TaxID=2608089 RepID=UPI003296D292
MKKILLSVSIILCSILSYSQNSCDLVVKVENIKEVKGSLKIAIYNQEDHFLSKEMMSDGKMIDSNQVEFIFKGLGEGTYAISLYHDENDNGKLDANFIGIPSEPYAFSNNAKGMFGPPSFAECKFEVKGPAQEIVISL